jgi:hypothetical protein
VPQISRPITSFNRYRAMCSRNAPLMSKVSSPPYKHMTACDTNSNSLTCLKATSSLCLSLIHMPELAIHLTIGATKQAYVHTVIAKGSMVGERRRALLSWSKRELGGLGLLQFSASPSLLSNSNFSIVDRPCRNASPCQTCQPRSASHLSDAHLLCGMLLNGFHSMKWSRLGSSNAHYTTVIWHHVKTYSNERKTLESHINSVVRSSP